MKMERTLKILGWLLIMCPIWIYGSVLLGRQITVGGEVLGWIAAIVAALLLLGAHLIVAHDVRHRTDIVHDEKQGFTGHPWLSWRYPFFFIYLLTGGYRKKIK
jgi:uncharacterized membrane protein